MKSETLADITCLSANLFDTVYAHLLIDRSLSSIPLTQLNVSMSNKKKILRFAPHINHISKEEFIIHGETLDIHAAALPKVKPFLQKQFIKLIAPPNYIVPQLDSVDHLDMPFGQKNYQAFYSRYATQDSYPTETLRLFSVMTEQLCSTNIVCPPKGTRFLLFAFSDFIRATRHVWRKIIGDLLNNELAPRAEVTNYWENIPHGLQCIEWINRSLNTPPLLYAEKNKLFISSVYWDDPTTVLPYLIPLFDFAFAPHSLLDKLLYSVLAKNGKVV